MEKIRTDNTYLYKRDDFKKEEADIREKLEYARTAVSNNTTLLYKEEVKLNRKKDEIALEKDIIKSR